ncbi:MAG: hypothetical protein KAS32_09085 [Candidatus Peribacteraceae bacterium]|nr:hypothetical protein [Candidatus Peribacteraceae bacterium]
MDDPLCHKDCPINNPWKECIFMWAEYNYGHAKRCSFKRTFLFLIKSDDDSELIDKINKNGTEE